MPSRPVGCAAQRGCSRTSPRASSTARGRGDADAERDAARRAIDIGRRFNGADIVALGQYVEGRLLVRQGDVNDGMATLDEAMLAATQGELGSMATGQLYCNVIAACQELGDLRRAGEWD